MVVFWFLVALAITQVIFPNNSAPITAKGQCQTIQQDDCPEAGCKKETFWIFEREKEGLYFKYPKFRNSINGIKMVAEEHSCGRRNDLIVNTKMDNRNGFVQLFMVGTPIVLFPVETGIPKAPIVFKFGMYKSFMFKGLQEIWGVQKILNMTAKHYRKP